MSFRLRPLRVAVAVCAVAGIAGLAAAQQPDTKAPAAKPAEAPAAKPAEPGKDPVVATVDGQPIHLSDLETAQQSLPQQYRNIPLANVFPALLDRMISSKLVELDGRKNKVTDDPEFKKRLAFVEDQVIQDFWLKKQIAEKVTPEKIKQAYDEKLKSLPAEEEVHARHILVATEPEAKAIIADLKKGTPFDKLAKEKSTDKASGAEGGDLGWFKKTDMVKEFADAAFALKKGALSDSPIKTQFGYHVIQVEDRRQAPPPSLDEMSDQIRQDLERDMVTAMLNQLRAGAKIDKFNIDGSVPAPASTAPDTKPKTPAAPAPATPSK